MTNHMTKPEQFDAAFMAVEHLVEGIANVMDNGVTLLVQPGYCAHCRDIEDGVPWCIHKEAAFGQDDAQDQYETYREALYS